MAAQPGIIIRPAGASALLLYSASERYSAEMQEKIWALAAHLRDVPGLREAVPGMNNLLAVFDAFALAPAALETELRRLWTDLAPLTVAGKVVEIPVIYGGARGEDLGAWARHCGLSREDVVRRHASALYRVAALGAMPGFPYLAGLPPELAMGRRDVPRLAVARGAVIIGGAQAGVMPTEAPSGWHVIGHAEIALFQIDRDAPALLAPGDTVRFRIAGLEND